MLLLLFFLLREVSTYITYTIEKREDYLPPSASCFSGLEMKSLHLSVCLEKFSPAPFSWINDLASRQCASQ